MVVLLGFPTHQYTGLMLVPELNLIFIHVMKTGGSSISDALMAQFPESAKKVQTRDYQDMVHLFETKDSLGFSKHASVARYSRALGENKFSAIDVVAVYRNPVHRALSAHFCPSVRKNKDPKFSIYGLHQLIRGRKSLFQMLRANGDQVSPSSISLMNFARLDAAAKDIAAQVPGFPTNLPHLNPTRRPGYERNWLFLTVAFLMVATSHHVFDFLLSPGISSSQKLGKVRLWILGF